MDERGRCTIHVTFLGCSVTLDANSGSDLQGHGLSYAVGSSSDGIVTEIDKNGSETNRKGGFVG